MTSLFREEVTVPIPSAASSTITSRPDWARRRATASPITPAPITTHSTLSMDGFLSGNWRNLQGSAARSGQLVVDRILRDKSLSGLEKPVPVRDALIMSGQLPQIESDF